jgi:hypothetical protein
MPQFTTELFVDMLILILHCKDVVSVQLVERMLALYEEETKGNTKLANGEYLDLYVEMIKLVLHNTLDLNNVDTILLKYKANPVIVKDPELYTSLKSILSDATPLNQDMIKYYQNEILAVTVMFDTNTAVNKIFAVSRNHGRGTEELFETIRKVNTLCSDLAQHNQKILENLNASSTIVRDVDFCDDASIARGFEVYNTVNVKNVFVTGLQGLNRALGGRGIKLGESLVINTLPFMGKSLMLLKIARWIVTNNKLSDEFKNPTCLFYSLENETPQNLRQLFIELWISNKKELPPDNIHINSMTEYISTEFRKHGWKFVIKRRVGAEFGTNELITDFNNHVAAGQTPLAVIIDYVNLMKKEDDTSRDLAVRNLYSTLCNFLKSNNCCFITAHQLNRKAAEVVRANPLGAVKKFTLDMLSDSTDPQREVDVVLYQHKEIDSLGRAWLTWKLDKHRYDTVTPECDKYFAYMFDGQLGIVDDLGGEDKSTTNIYAATTDEIDDGNDDALALQI